MIGEQTPRGSENRTEEEGEDRGLNQWQARPARLFKAPDEEQGEQSSLATVRARPKKKGYLITPSVGSSAEHAESLVKKGKRCLVKGKA